MRERFSLIPQNAFSSVFRCCFIPKLSFFSWYFPGDRTVSLPNLGRLGAALLSHHPSPRCELNERLLLAVSLSCEVFFRFHLLSLQLGTLHILDAMKKAGHDISTLFLCGGLSKNALFVQTHANATGTPIRVFTFQVDFLPKWIDLFGERALIRVTFTDLREVSCVLSVPQGCLWCCQTRPRRFWWERQSWEHVRHVTTAPCRYTTKQRFLFIALHFTIKGASQLCSQNWLNKLSWVESLQKCVCGWNFTKKMMRSGDRGGW